MTLAGRNVAVEGSLAAAPLASQPRLAGALLLLAFVLFAIGATLPLLGEKGNWGIYTLPTREHLLAVANNVMAWRWGNIFMIASALALLAGLALLASVLEGAGEVTLSRLGLGGLQIAATLWVMFSAWRATVTVLAAQETLATGVIPPLYEPLAQWAGALFLGYAVVGFLALAAYGGSLLQFQLVPGWMAWATLVFCAAMLILLFVTGDTLPAFHYLPGLLLGISLVTR